MELSNLTERKIVKTLLCALLTTPIISGTTLAHEDVSEPFTMAVITDTALGDRVQSGRYEQAISKLTGSRIHSFDKFARQNNLCVAYAKTVDLTNAVAACDAAIAKVREREELAHKRPRRSHAARAYRSDLAIALSNRGVLLAVQGDIDEAKEAFEAAIELKSGISRIAARNLERLMQMGDESDV